MALVVEDGTGKADAESPQSVTDLDAWAVKLNWGSAWPAVGVDVAKKEAWAREANDWLEAQFSHRIEAAPLNPEQRLTFPANGFVYPRGRTLPAGAWLPIEWAKAHALATFEASQGTLSPNLERGGQVIEETVDVITTRWADSAPAETTFQKIRDAARALWDFGYIRTVRG